MVAVGDLVSGGGWIWRSEPVVRKGSSSNPVAEECEAKDDAPLLDVGQLYDEGTGGAENGEGREERKNRMPILMACLTSI